MPPDAVPDKYDYVFTYEKDGKKKEFPMTGLPDSTWSFVDRKQILVEKGKNNIPLINDFNLVTDDGIDSTEAILSQPGEYYLVFIKELPDNSKEWVNNLKALSGTKGARKMYIITAQKNIVRTFAEKNAIAIDGLFGCDVTSIKTASRATPTIYLMKGPIVQGKWGWADFEEIKK